MSVSTRNRGTTRYHWRTFISLYWCGHVLSYSSAFVERVCTWLLTSSEINIQKERACQQYMGLSPCLPNCYFKMDYVILAGYSPRLVTRDPWPVTYGIRNIGICYRDDTFACKEGRPFCFQSTLDVESTLLDTLWNKLESSGLLGIYNNILLWVVTL